MKLLYFTDPHLTAKNPIGRLDNYAVAAYRKFQEIGRIIQEQKINHVLIGGDLFNVAKISLKYSNLMARVMRDWDVPIYVVPGSHDLYGYNLDTIDQTSLGNLHATGVVQLLTRGGDTLDLEYEDIKGKSAFLQVIGEEHSLTSTFDYLRPRDAHCDYQIQIIHDMLMERPYLPTVPHAVTKDVHTLADLVLGAHYHPGWTTHTINGVTFMNPGSLMRLDRSEANKTTVPKVLIIDASDITNVQITERPLKSARPATEIFDFASKAQQAAQQQQLINFKAQLQSGGPAAGPMTIHQLMAKIVQDTGLPVSILTEAQNAITAAEQNVQNSCPTLKGYVESPIHVWITEVEIENFQSHSHSVIQFQQGLNALIGESNHGKTAILRAIRWAEYNDPRGDSIIRTGSARAKVRVTYSSGWSIVRERDRSSAGTYKVIDPNGVVQDFKGFGNEVPIEVTNVHQKPKVYLAKDFEQNLSMAEQLDPPFLIGAMGSQRAAAIGRLIGVQVVDDAIQEVNRSLKADSKDKTRLESEKEQKVKELAFYDDQPKIKLALDRMQLLLEATEKLQEKIETASWLLTSLQETQRQKQEIRSKLSAMPRDDLQLPQLEQLERDVRFMNFIKKTIDQKARIESAKARAIETLQYIPNEAFLNRLIESLEKTQVKIAEAFSFQHKRRSILLEIKDVQEKIIKIDYEGVEQLLVQTEQKRQALESSVGYLKQLRLAQSSRQLAFNAVENSIVLEAQCDKALVTSQKEFADWLVSIGTCPTCGNNLTEQHIDHMIGKEAV